jgi:hypothetical protein
MSSAPTLAPVHPIDAPAPGDVIPYASPPIAKARITYRGAVTTLIVGGAFLVLSVGLIALAWSIFRNYAEMSTTSYRAGSLEGLGIFTGVLAAFSFTVGVVIVFMGLRGVRQRELD